MSAHDFILELSCAKGWPGTINLPPEKWEEIMEAFAQDKIAEEIMRREKAEAEVERLKTELQKAIRL